MLSLFVNIRQRHITWYIAGFIDALVVVAVFWWLL